MAHHHYIPKRALLAAFTMQGRPKHVWVWDKKIGKAITPNIDKIFGEKNLYDARLFEGIFGEFLDPEAAINKEIENPSIEIIDRIRRDGTIATLDDQDTIRLLRLVSLQIIRTPGFRARLQGLASVISNGPFAPELATEAWPSQQFLALGLTTEAPGIARGLRAWNMHLYQAPPGQEFVLGDEPFIVRRGALVPDLPSNFHVGYEFNLPGASLWLPLSPTLCLHLAKSPQYDRRRAGSVHPTEVISSILLREHNELQIARARRFVACKSGEFVSHGLS